MNKKILAMLLVVVMIIGMVPMAAMATEDAGCQYGHQLGDPVFEEGTCMTEGKMTQYCQRCGEVGFETTTGYNTNKHVEGCPHQEAPHVHDYKNQTTLSEGTCTTEAQFWVYCDCGDGFEVKGEVNAEAHYEGCPHQEAPHVHDYKNQITLSEGTCTTEAQFWVYCDCGDAFEVKGEVNAEAHYEGCPHQGGKHVHDYKNQITLSEGTCITEAQFWVYCDCGDAFEVKGELNKDGHLYVGSESKEPTCTEAGFKEHTCTICGKIDHYDVPALGHKLVETKVEPTYLATGSITKTCTVCGHSETEVLPKLVPASTDGYDYVPRTGSAFVEWLYALIFG